MKYFSITISLLAAVSSCSENKIEVGGGRHDMPEPDRAMRISWEINEAIDLISYEIENSDSIEICISGKKLINSGFQILPYLEEKFTDSSATAVFSRMNNRNLLKGEIAIIVASAIKPIPIARVVGIQQCTPPFNMDIESYLPIIHENPINFRTKYHSWLKEEIKSNK